MQLNKQIVFSIFLVVFLFSSCVPVSRIAYVQSDRGTHPSQMVYEGEAVDTKIRPGDEVYIRISSADDDPTNITGDAQRVYDANLMSYTVNDKGEVKLPYTGRINLEGLSLEEASDKIEESLGQYLYLPSVYVRFINTKVTVLGEVNQPGVYMFDYKNINILQAIGYARDITEFGNRRDVLLIREEGSKRSKHYIDLLDDDLLESEWYTLKSGDVVFVEPMSRKKWGMTTVPYNLLLTIISTGLFVYTAFN